MPTVDIEALLRSLALGCGARRILEIGTGHGDATLVLATTLPSDGMMITMEMDAALAGQARERLGAAGHEHRVSVMVGEATRFLHKIAGPFDLILQDSHPQSYEQMLDRLVELLRPGGLLVMDHVAASGGDETMVALRHRLAADPQLHTSFLQVGDGVSVSVRRAS